jgi:hypothetical protein
MNLRMTRLARWTVESLYVLSASRSLPASQGCGMVCSGCCSGQLLAPSELLTKIGHTFTASSRAETATETLILYG